MRISVNALVTSSALARRSAKNGRTRAKAAGPKQQDNLFAAIRVAKMTFHLINDPIKNCRNSKLLSHDSNLVETHWPVAPHVLFVFVIFAICMCVRVCERARRPVLLGQGSVHTHTHARIQRTHFRLLSQYQKHKKEEKRKSFVTIHNNNNNWNMWQLAMWIRRTQARTRIEMERKRDRFTWMDSSQRKTCEWTDGTGKNMYNKME